MNLVEVALLQLTLLAAQCPIEGDVPLALEEQMQTAAMLALELGASLDIIDAAVRSGFAQADEEAAK